MRYEVTTKMSPQEAIAYAKDYFGPSGVGLQVMDENELCVTLQGGGGHVSVVACADEKKTVLDLEVLLVGDEKQAYARCIGAKLNRGREAARAAAAMIDVFQELDRTMPVKNTISKKQRYA